MLQYAAMDPFEFHRLGLTKFNPAKATRRQVRLEIYLPFGVSVLALVAAVVLLRRTGVGDASVWADVALAILLGMSLIFGLLLLVVVTSAAVGVWYLVRLLPAPFADAQLTLAKARSAANEASDQAAKAVILPSAGVDAIRAGVRHLSSIFKR